MPETISEESKLFFSGEYEACLRLIRRKLNELNNWDKKSKENLAILGAQCLFELQKGNEMRGFLELCYESNILNTPAMVFFVWIHYLYYMNEFDMAIKWLKQFKKQGRPMNRNEKEQYIRIIIFDGYCNQRKYKMALDYLENEFDIDLVFKKNIIKEVKNKLKNDTWNGNNNNIDTDSESNDIKHDINAFNDNNDDNIPLNDDTKDELKDDSNIDSNNNESTIRVITSNLIVFVKEKTNKMDIYKFIGICFIIFIIVKLWNSRFNKKLREIIINDFKRIFLMGFGKSRISVQ